jgi:hypothetical protein
MRLRLPPLGALVLQLSPEDRARLAAEAERHRIEAGGPEEAAPAPVQPALWIAMDVQTARAMREAAPVAEPDTTEDDLLDRPDRAAGPTAAEPPARYIDTGRPDAAPRAPRNGGERNVKNGKGRRRK